MLGAGIELVSVRCEAIGTRGMVLKTLYDSQGSLDDARKLPRDVYWHDQKQFVTTEIFDGLALGVGVRVAGPSIVELPDTAIVIQPGQSLSRDAFGNFILQL